MVKVVTTLNGVSSARRHGRRTEQAGKAGHDCHFEEITHHPLAPIIGLP
jgi:hypothetical protein